MWEVDQMKRPPQWTKPANYDYLTRWEWFAREAAIFGCRTDTFHIRNEWGCWCDFWDAQ